MKNIFLTAASLILLCSCSSHGWFGKSSKSSSGPRLRSANAHATEESAGSAYEDSIRAAMNANQYTLCRDLTDEEIENAGNGPGSGYHDSQEAAENANQYAEVDHFEMDDGTDIIIDEHGVHVIS